MPGMSFSSIRLVNPNSTAQRHRFLPKYAKSPRLSKPSRISIVTPTQAPTSEGSATRTSERNPILIRFKLNRRTEFGRGHRIVGDCPALGNWDVSEGAEMSWTPNDVWTASAQVPPGATIEFKCIEIQSDDQTDCSGDDIRWEPGHNHAIVVPESGHQPVSLDVTVHWGKDVEVTVTQVADSDNSSSKDQDDQDGKSKMEQSFEQDQAINQPHATEQLPNLEWKGPPTVFKSASQSVEGSSRATRATWDTNGLEGAAYRLVSGDKEASSWLRKLQMVKDLLVDSAPAMRPSLDAIAHAYVYLAWVATGTIVCEEAGGHRRPNHHAELSRLTFRSLEWVIAERSGQPDALLARRIQTRLPSFSQEFLHSTPLTRIRDIAHRNDIPQSLKQEIKHTIQNKLHRSAGPEDLVATEALLARVTAVPGEYSENFITELRTFLMELRDFFNAASFTDALKGLLPSLDDPSVQMVERFLSYKASLDASSVVHGSSTDDSDSSGPEEIAGTNPVNVSDNTIMDALHAATSVRALLASGLASGLRNDAPEAALSMRQRWRMAEIRAEDYCFVLLSRFINVLESRGGAENLAKGNDGGWGLPLGALVLSLRQLGMCGFEPPECMALERELAMWQRLGGFSHPDEALRLRATLQRVMRVADSYSAVLVNSLSGAASVLGNALGVPDYQSLVFPESEVRANVVFQLSKLTSLLLKATTLVCKAEPWDVIAAGRAKGRLVEVSTLDAQTLKDALPKGEPAVVVVSTATGDEEVGSLGPALQGVILLQQLPHLSHLGVRARQEKVPFVTCDDSDTVTATVRGLLGEQVELTAYPDGVTLGPMSDFVSSAAGDLSNSRSTKTNGRLKDAIATVVKCTELAPIALVKATTESCGVKASNCGRLLRLQSSFPFKVPDGLVIPFGAMEIAMNLKENSDAGLKFNELLGLMAEAVDTNDMERLDELCSNMEKLIMGLHLPEFFLDKLLHVGNGGMGNEGQLIVRSSANVEDLEGLSGAGLFESIPNVRAGDAAALRSAITQVWASLYSRRAVVSLATKNDGVGRTFEIGQPQMAVIVQCQVSPALSFVLHTSHTLSKDGSEQWLVAEVAPGLGVTLASASRGSPWRLEISKSTGKVKTTSFANFSAAYSSASEGSKLMVMDYSSQPMSMSVDFRKALGGRLLEVGVALEREFEGCPQDVEGCIDMNDQLYVVQSRPQ